MTVKRKKVVGSMTVNTSTVNVTATGGRKKRKRNRKKKLVRAENQELAQEFNELSIGRLTDESSKTLTVLQALKAETCGLDPNEESWYFKYIDPAGSVETHRAIGEFSKIPDGLCTFSADAEIRVVHNLSLPLTDASEIPINERLWSLVVISYPMFRTGFIAVANVFNLAMGDIARQAFAVAVNNLENFSAVVRRGGWIPLQVEGESGWYYQIVPLPPTFDMPDPLSGITRTVTDYRISYKSITLEHNAPSLLDQGYWAGGHYALSDTPVSQETENTTEVPSWIVVRNYGVAGIPWTLTIPNLPPPSLVGQLADYISVDGQPASWWAIIINGTTFTYTVDVGYTWYSDYGAVFAESGDVITFMRTATSVTVDSTRAGTNPLIIGPLGFIFGDNASIKIFLDLPLVTEMGGTSKAIELVATTIDQVASNNPKMEQFLMKESNGAYAVHRKMRNPVFTLTPAASFGPVQFTTPGFMNSLNHSDGSGILDTIDLNFSTATIVVMGIAHANSPIVKLYQGWEGVTNVNTPIGQFAHSGLPKNDHLMQLVDSITTRTTGIYPANDNFLGLISKFASGLLKNLVTSEATAPMLGRLAEAAVGFGQERLRKRFAPTVSQLPYPSRLAQAY